VVTLNMDLYWMIIAAQRDDSHQSKCIRLKSGVNVFTKRFGLKRTLCFAGREPIKATEYTCFGRVTEYKYGVELSKAFRGYIPIQYLQNFGMSKKYYGFPLCVIFFIETLKQTNKQIPMAKYFKRCV